MERMDGNRVAVVREMTLDVSSEELWRWVSNADGWRGWLGDEPVVPVSIGDPGSLRADDGLRHLVLDHRDEGRSLGFVWWRDDDPAALSSVTFTIESDHVDPSRSRLRIEERPLVTAGARACSLGAAEGAWDSRLLGLELCLMNRNRVLV